MFPSFKEQIIIGGLQLNFLVDGQDTEGSLVMFEMLVLPNAKVPAPHFHVEVDETLYVLKGKLTMLYNTETRQLNPGDRLFALIMGLPMHIPKLRAFFVRCLRPASARLTFANWQP
jgi:quercetin dioxygenase-like cupin family protein